MSVEIISLLKLLCAHLLADFVLQPGKMVARKRPGRQGWHIGHAAVHALTATVAVWDISLWYLPLAIGVSHYAIDVWKSRAGESILNFVVDQALHLLVIATLWMTLGGWGCVAEYCVTVVPTPRFWAVVLGLLLVCNPSSIVIGKVIAWRWEDEATGMKKGLRDAGKWIGCLERLLIFVFVYNGVYQAIGFLLAAKSIFRFGELKDAKEIKTTEYIMIGTFMSFAIAIAVGLGVTLF